MLDLINEVVIPAFFSSKLKRSYGETKHFFHQVKLVEFCQGNTKFPCIIGKYVKNMVLESEQIYDIKSDSLIRNSSKLPSSPTALFVLLLDSHKLLYLAETRGAPTIEAFAATAKQFLRITHLEWLNQIYKSPNNKITKKALFEEYPPPSLEIIRLANEDSFGNFVQTYGLLQRIEIQLVDTNNETDNNGLFEDVRETGEALGADSSFFGFANKQGLKQQEVTRQLSSAASQGNSHFLLRGKDKSGKNLIGTDKEISEQYFVSGPLLPLIEMGRSMIKIILDSVDWQAKDLSADKLQKLATLETQMEMVDID